MKYVTGDRIIYVYMTSGGEQWLSKNWAAAFFEI